MGDFIVVTIIVHVFQVLFIAGILVMSSKSDLKGTINSKFDALLWFVIPWYWAYKVGVAAIKKIKELD
jgi:hypothetical protein